MILDDGIYMNLPLLVKQSVVLFPGQTLPMTVHGTDTIDMLQKCIDKDRTFGVVCLGHDKMVPIGTTAEIYQYKHDTESQGFRVKAKGRQRFKILRVIQVRLRSLLSLVHVTQVLNSIFTGLRQDISER